MTMTGWQKATVAAAAAIACFAVGRFTAPRIAPMQISTSERDTELSFRAYVGHTVIVAKTDTRWRTITRWEPGGTVVQVREVAQKSETIASKDETTSERRETEHASANLEKAAPAPPDWFVGGRAGVDARLSPLYGLSVGRRVLGPIFLEAWGQWPLAGGLGVGLAF